MLHADDEEDVPGSAAIDAATINEDEFSALEQAAMGSNGAHYQMLLASGCLAVHFCLVSCA